jgi:hypothetical protein
MHTLCTHNCEMACPYWIPIRRKLVPNATTRLDATVPICRNVWSFGGALVTGTEQILVTGAEKSRDDGHRGLGVMEDDATTGRAKSCPSFTMIGKVVAFCCQEKATASPRIE